MRFQPIVQTMTKQDFMFLPQNAIMYINFVHITAVPSMEMAMVGLASCDRITFSHN